MKNKKRIFLIIGIILVIIVGVIGYLVVGDLKQEEILKQEIVDISSKDIINDNFEIEIKTKGDYAYIEKAIKTYYKELSDNTKIIKSSLDNQELMDVLTPENLQKNRPDFTESYKILDEANEKATEAINNIANLCSEEKIKSLIDEDKVDDYYIDLYQKLMYTEKDLKELQELKKEMETLSNDLNTFIDKVKEILDLLKTNNSNWEIQGNQIYFSNNGLINKYQKLYNDLNKLVNEKFQTSNTTNKDYKNDL